VHDDDETHKELEVEDLSFNLWEVQIVNFVHYLLLVLCDLNQGAAKGRNGGLWNLVVVELKEEG
jgi:hypothetical protein